MIWVTFTGQLFQPPLTISLADRVSLERETLRVSTHTPCWLWTWHATVLAPPPPPHLCRRQTRICTINKWHCLVTSTHSVSHSHWTNFGCALFIKRVGARVIKKPEPGAYVGRGPLLFRRSAKSAPLVEIDMSEKMEKLWAREMHSHKWSHI